MAPYEKLKEFCLYKNLDNSKCSKLRLGNLFAIGYGANACGISPGLLQDYVQSLLNEKIIDERFSQIRTKLEEPDFIQLINVYLNDVESRLSEFSCFIDSVDVNFSKLSMMAHKIEEKSTRIGARHMKLASIHLIQACDKEDHKLVSQSLCWMKHEFINTRNKLQPVLQMEQRILRLMSKQT
ncbi:histidine-containing phosphotransfer protein 5-like isoform X6 [Cucurbita pepo subsp. pepo]|uniref:histidine-containing phosphotransfer protein 5-like isoform X5 n=1 Tax=Cucurbita pepo subsp. pepo TaxID=3664 RepID=UPI000C9D53C0|nr:histidine-containing phosphotransfer protein 5-like isoform X5 [Cucurbita pepo subsp. pepo]XP_023534678.1 histidine-containing phosphotransfer protein 5-like isoform X6 [Cucurbita pepo subsp. pepo]